jgi:hypothetical protein
MERLIPELTEGTERWDGLSSDVGVGDQGSGKARALTPDPDRRNDAASAQVAAV